MSDTLETAPRRRTHTPHGRTPWIIGAVVVVVALAAWAGSAILGGDDKGGQPVVRMGTVEHEVTYEVSGTGRVPLITYAVGELNSTTDLKDVALPWKQTISLPVGPAGNFAQVEVKSPQQGTGSIACRVFVDGKLAEQQNTTDGFAGVACASRISPEYVK